MKKELDVREFLDLTIEEIFADRFSRYSKYIIQDRALPDVRDGLKPVQRRILYAMYRDGNTFNKPFRKSAKTVGNVIGNYHPHGDSSVYEAMVRMSQLWKVNEQLVVMHGNNGSIDGDSAAAMRYTEAKMSEYSEIMLEHIDENTVNMIPNFDDTELEPTVLPTRIPNLLINGATGISSGYATDIPPHNPEEVLKAAIKLNKKPSMTLDEIIEIIPAPDFPTGGIIQGADEIKRAYETGRGKIVIRSEYEYQKNNIVISSIPYEVNKSTLIQKIEMIRIDNRVSGIIEVVDHSDQNGLEIVIACKKDANKDVIIKYLLKNTDLQKNYNFNVIAINNRRPELMGIKQILEAFLAHRREVITLRSEYRLEKANARLHILEGLMKAVDILDEIVAIIRQSKNKADSKKNIIERFDFTEEQAEAIVMMQLYRLSNTDMENLLANAKTLKLEVEELTAILESEKVLKDVINRELRDVLKLIKHPRRTKVEAKIEKIEINQNDLIKQENTVVAVTCEGYIKRSTQRSYLASNVMSTKLDSDQVIANISTNTKEIAVIFFDDGTVVNIPVHEIPDLKWKDLGKHISTIANINDGVQVVQAMCVAPELENYSLLGISKQGYLTHIDIAEILAGRMKNKAVYQKLKQDDQLVDVICFKQSDDPLTIDFITVVFDNDKFVNVPLVKFELGKAKRVGKRVTSSKNVAVLRMVNAQDGLVAWTNKGGYFIANTSKLIEVNRPQKLFNNFKTDMHEIIALHPNRYQEAILIAQDGEHIVKISDLKVSQAGDKLKIYDKTLKLDSVEKMLELR